ncbi:MAG TPA: ATP-binding cassette domain-containing protein [Kiloniellaceae bacterium]|nr:ATP-binding cassette domain-containing protein [Kiloniellaceae bacterium]
MTDRSDIRLSEDARPQAAAAPVIRVETLQAHYGERQVLHDVDLTVRPGEIMVIMGGSGSGKSTLLRHLVGLTRPTAGRVELLGLDITRAGAMEMMRLRRKLGVAFQGGALFSSMTVLENVMLPLQEHTQLDRKTMEIMARLKLEVVNLAEAEAMMPAELSGGMLKRAAVARAIVMDPALLFFDEPSAGLDPVVSAALDDLILKLRDAMNMTIVVVTHELESAFKIADRITVLDQGRILLVDDVAGVRRSGNPRIQNLLNRRSEETEVDARSYLRRLTGEVPPAPALHSEDSGAP